MNINGILERIENVKGANYLKITPMDLCTIEEVEEINLLRSNDEELYLTENLKNLEAFAKENSIDFIDLELNDTINFVWYTELDNKKDIVEKGMLSIPEKMKNELRDGIHGANCYDPDSIFVVTRKYTTDLNSRLLKLFTKYTGPFTKRLYGGEFTDFVTIPSFDLRQVEEIENVSMENELYRFY